MEVQEDLGATETVVKLVTNTTKTVVITPLLKTVVKMVVNPITVVRDAIEIVVTATETIIRSFYKHIHSLG